MCGGGSSDKSLAFAEAIDKQMARCETE